MKAKNIFAFINRNNYSLPADKTTQVKKPDLNRFVTEKKF